MTDNLLGNRYHIIRPLGSGGFGDTYLAEDQHSPARRRCVVKKLRPISHEPQMYQMVKDRFDREAAILEDLGHGHSQIPALYAYFEQEGLFYLVEEWVEGSTLTEVVSQHGPQSESTVKEILTRLLPILDYVHGKRMVHRDIKPDNIILRVGDQQPVLIDFGAVKETMGSTITASGNSTRSIVVGTPGFMPSEQSAGRPVFASDLYSLGLTAVYLLTGKAPQELATNPATGEISWRQYAPMLSPTLGNIIEQAIQIHPRDRFTTATAMLAAIQGVSVNPSPGIIPSTVMSMPTPSVATPPTHQPLTVIAASPPPSTPVTQPQNGSALSEWQKAAITGSIVGIFVVLAIVLTQSPNLFASKNTDEEPSSETNSETVEPELELANTEETQSESSQPDVIETQEAPSTAPNNSPPSTTPASSSNLTNNPVPQQPTLSQDEALQLVNNWQSYKRRLFAPPYDRSQGSQLLTGSAYGKNIRRSDGQQSSVDWLRSNNAHYEYGVQKIDRVENLVGDENYASFTVVLTEQRTLYVNGKRSNDENSGLETLRVNYSLQRDGGRWKIADYQTETLSHQ
ncbi:IMS domain-containing protein [Spirulina major CS-329]|uniref:protein kinase domain-containing protein n=1 Tax=Spirulina TaxID=1154 RepID=UPI00232F31ED|nr:MULTISPECIES: IMS domain-containing protein [Spirulina]MDB9494717.1 IMS domain-containing protein [Spirulina subsalsa CS-330]MDB9502747.1 IMS domain-containing protein [Spirulina major CS-329]